MKKRLFYIIIMISVIAATVTGILSSLAYYEFYVKESEEQLKAIVKLSSYYNWNDYSGIHESVNNIIKSVNYEIRITIVEDSGNVIFDNFADSETIDNHIKRPEIENAFNIGYGEDTRLSKTLKNETYYYSVKLDNGTVLRLSREMSSIRNMFDNILPILMGIFFLIVLIAFIIASSITKKIIKPIKHMTKSLDDLIEGYEFNPHIVIYEELEPLAHKITEQKIKINKYINEIKYERDTIGVIIENMKEGFILLNKDKDILSINASGKRMVGNEKFNLNEHKNILELTRNIQIINNIETSIKENKHIVSNVDTKRYHYRYYYNPVSEKPNLVDGIMILIEDVTIEKNAEIMRHEFSANVSHELKTPLTTMIGFAEMIKEGLITDSESIKKYCGMINKEGLRLIALIEDIIRLSKIEEGIDIDSDNIVNLKDVSSEVCNLLQEKANLNNIKIILHAENIVMKANRNYINELLYNLVDNGIKYNKEEGKVKININKSNDYICIVVRDSGVGISNEHQDRIFERFYRVDKSRSKETGGTGLGLSIVKHIVEMYNGNIQLKSTEHIGTEIKIKFPL